MSRVAINVCDLDALVPRGAGFNPVALLLRDFCTADSPTVTPDKDRWDSAAVVLDGPAAQDEERLEALVELLQTSIGPRKLGGCSVSECFPQNYLPDYCSGTPMKRAFTIRCTQILIA